MTAIIQIENVVLPSGFVYDEVRQLDSASGCSVKLNLSESDTCRICCD
jgi:hypothetical protein